jgi:sirohydrochlorin cobaltochelatase
VQPPQIWQDEALLLVAHGAPRHAHADRALQAHAAALRALGCFAQVAVALLNGAPLPAEALASLRPQVVHVVPFFMEQGWFVREAIPRALAHRQGHVLRFHKPVGLHPALPERAAARVRAACGAAAAGTSVLLVGHGSARSPGRPMALHRHAAAIAAAGDFAAVRAAFLEEPPLVADALHDWRDCPIAVVGFFAGDGGHVRDDLPALLSAARTQRGGNAGPLLDVGTIGDDPAMPGIILDLVAEAP